MKKITLINLLVAVIILAGLSPLSAQHTPIGFASLSGKGVDSTTGGAGGDTVTVTTWNDLKNYVESTTPYIILIEGTIPAPNKGDGIRVNSNKTIVGIGKDATLYQGEFEIFYKENVIIRNLNIRDSYVEDDPSGKTQDFDAIQIDESHHIWIDHCHFSNCGDGLIDLRKASDYVTVSWTKLSDHYKTFGTGWTDETTWHVTIHHCWFENTQARNPALDNGIMHLFNNYLHNVSDYGNNPRGQARVTIENSFFENVKDPINIDSNAKAYVAGCEFVNCSGNTAGNVNQAPVDPALYYDYQLDPVSQVPNILRTGAGPQNFVSNYYTGVNEQYALAVDVSEGNGSVTPGSGDFQAGEKITLTAVPEEGWLFDGWTGDVSGDSEALSFVLSQDMTVSASFKEDPATSIVDGEEADNSNFNVYPNVFGSNLNIEVNSEMNQLVKVELLSLGGNVLMNQSFMVQPGYNHLKINTAEAGCQHLCLLQITCNQTGEFYVEKVMKE